MKMIKNFVEKKQKELFTEVQIIMESGLMIKFLLDIKDYQLMIFQKKQISHY